jgi:TPR repeat protein
MEPSPAIEEATGKENLQVAAPIVAEAEDPVAPVVKESLIAESAPVATVEPKLDTPPVAVAAPAPKQQPPEDDAEATYQLGLRYEIGNGIEKDAEAAAICYEEAANAGHAEAMYKLGLCYCVGKGVDKDEETGKEWLKESAKAGHPDAKLAFDCILANSPPLAVLAAAWMTHPVGDGLRQKDKDKADKEVEEKDENGRHLSPAEIVQRRMDFANRLIGGGRRRSVYEPWHSFNSPSEASQRDTFIRWTLKGGLPNKMPGERPR